MANAWNGADPTNVVDPSPYEMGTEMRANSDLTITGVRIWGDNSTVSGREARIWNPTSQAVITTIPLPDTLSAGWSEHVLTTPVLRLSGQRWVISYHTGGNYGAVPGALVSDVTSDDGAVTTLANTNATNGNGVFNTAPAVFPAQTFGSTFYGVDTVYIVGGEQTPPTIQSVTVASDGLDVDLTISATDPDGLSGAVYRVEWGDGSTSSGASATPSHTYAASGTYAALVSVTDSTGLSDYVAVLVPVQADVVRVGDPVVVPLARELLACLDQEVVKTADPPARVEMRVGTVVDHLLSTTDDECCDGLAWVRVDRVFPSSSTFPVQDEVPLPKGTAAWAVVLEMGVIRCAPTPGPSRTPTGDEWDDVFQTVMDDGAAMRRAVCCFIDAEPTRARRTLPGEWEPISVQGGCTGGTLRVTVRGPACDCSEAGPS